MADTRVRVDVVSPDGSTVGPGPITSVLAGSYEHGLGEVGSFILDVPAEDPRSSLLAHGYELGITRGGEGLVFRGIVDKLTTVIGADERKVLRVSGEPTRQAWRVTRGASRGPTTGTRRRATCPTRVLSGDPPAARAVRARG